MQRRRKPGEAAADHADIAPQIARQTGVLDRAHRVLSGAGYQVLRYDMFGRGMSDRPEAEYDRAMYLQQLEEMLVKMDWDEKFDIVGYSFGAAIAAEYAAKHPDMINSLVLIAPLVDYSARIPDAA